MRVCVVFEAFLLLVRDQLMKYLPLLWDSHESDNITIVLCNFLVLWMGPPCTCVPDFPLVRGRSAFKCEHSWGCTCSCTHACMVRVQSTVVACSTLLLSPLLPCTRGNYTFTWTKSKRDFVRIHLHFNLFKTIQNSTLQNQLGVPPAGYRHLYNKFVIRSTLLLPSILY